MIGYLANLGVPRSGEFLRATAISTYEDIPFQKGFGTIITERVIDLIMLLIIILLAFILQADVIATYLNEFGVNLVVSIAVLIVGIVGLIVLIQFTKKATSGFFSSSKIF